MDRTGIVRRMDEPKEIRRVMRLAEGEEMEIFPEGDQFVVRKHSRFSALGRTVDAVVGLLAEHTGCEVFLAAAGVVTAAGGKMRKALLARPLTEGFAARFRGRERVCVKEKSGLSPVEGTDVGGSVIAIPIGCAGDVTGRLFLAGEGAEEAEALAAFAAELLGELCGE